MKNGYFCEDGIKNGDMVWYKNGKVHSNVNHIVYSNGSKSWYKNGLLHREDGPAIEQTDGTKSWYKNGLLHREDGPAIEQTDGTKSWYKNGLLHREDGPAIEQIDGTKSWYKNGKMIEKDNIEHVINVKVNIVKNEIDLKQVKTLSSFSAISEALQERKVTRTNILEQFYEEVSKDPDHIKIYLQKYQERLT